MMIKEVIEETKYFTCESTDVLNVEDFDDGDVIKTDKNQIFKVENNQFVDFSTSRSGIINVFTEAVVLVKSNMARSKITIQNNGTYPVLLKVSDIVSNENFDYVLKPSTVRNYGDGGVFVSDSIKMQISAMAINGETTLSIIEEVTI
jgi:hypothetical protein